MNVNEAIKRLQELREKIGGDAPLWMADSEPVYFVVADNSWLRNDLLHLKVPVPVPDYEQHVCVTDRHEEESDDEDNEEPLVPSGDSGAEVTA